MKTSAPPIKRSRGPILVVMLMSDPDRGRSFGGVDTVCQMHLHGLVEHASHDESYHVLAFSPANELPGEGVVKRLSDHVTLEHHNANQAKTGALRRVPNFIAQEMLISRAARKLKPWLIHSHIPNWPVMRHAGAKKVMTLHSWGKISRFDHGFLNNFLHECILQPASLARTDGVISVSRDILAELAETRATTHDYIPNPLHRQFFTSPITPEPCGPVNIMLCGGVIPRKRFLDALDVLALVKRTHPDTRLTIVGPYDERNEYYKTVIATIDRLNLKDSVRLTGRIKSTEVVEELDKGHIGLSMSEDETFGLAPLEMMARGLPVVATQVGVMSWDGGSLSTMGASLVETGDVKAAAEHVQQLILRNEFRRVPDALEKRYSLEGYIAANTAIYRRLADIS